MQKKKSYAKIKLFDKLMTFGDVFMKNGDEKNAGLCYEKAAALWETIVRSPAPLTDAEKHLFIQEYCLN
jgi:hypothetical protein